MRAITFELVSVLALSGMILLSAGSAFADENASVHVSWGHRSPTNTGFFVRVLGEEVSLENFREEGCEPPDVISGNTVRSQAGAGDVDGLVFQIRDKSVAIAPITNLHSIWKYLVDHSDAATAGRLLADPGNRPDSRQITIQLNEAGTRGFSITIDQLQRNKGFWIPELDFFVGLEGVTFTNTLHELEPFRGHRIQDIAQKGAEPTYADFTRLWEDMGSPAYKNPHSVPPGHIICLSWHGSLHKFGIDRGGGVHSD